MEDMSLTPHTSNNIEPSTEGGSKDHESPEIDIIINNVVCTFYTRCHLNLKTIAMTGMNVVYRRENGMVSMKLRNPSVTASIWSSGKITCTGSTSEEESKVAARKVARCLWRLGFNVKFCKFRIVNVLGTCSMPFRIQITEFSRNNPKTASYEPELHPGVTYKLFDPKATIKIFSTGSLTVTAPSVANVQLAIEHIYSKVYEYRLVGQPNVPTNDNDYDNEAYQLFLQHTNNNTNLITYKRSKSGKSLLLGPVSKKTKTSKNKDSDKEDWSDDDDSN